MKFNFKIQPYQTDAVKSTVDVFLGQGFRDDFEYVRDLGKVKKQAQGEIVLPQRDEFDEVLDLGDDSGFRNEDVTLADEDLLKNIHNVQNDKNIKLSSKLVNDFGRCCLDIDMETGTGKTYVYIKTIFELNQKYGWSKFIIVVPSIAIREGVKKTLEITTEHFMEHYKKKARFFVYNSSNLNQLDVFSSSSGINIMVINSQAFASSMKEGAKNKESRIIYSKRDEFASRKPIDVIKANRPIIILDEPQKLGGEATQKALKNFNPLFTLNYSATHKKSNNTVFALDAVEAYNQKLVKKIEVKGFEVKNLRGTDKYLYLENIIVSPKKPPKAKIEIEMLIGGVVKRKQVLVNENDDLYYSSKEMEQYKGFVVSEIDPLTNSVNFTNGESIVKGEITGDVSEKDLRRIQIRETILSHFEKEEMLFNMGIKTLSLFFIDEVAKYRNYDENGDEILGEYGQIFEEEYLYALNEAVKLGDTDYQKYLKEQCSDINRVHNGYFSVDKKTGKSVDSETKRGSEFSDDISAYDLILKNKERLLSFNEPTRFIFSHSALREGWDNPNVFQICTLKHSENKTAKRQEVGRGLRMCVDSNGNRMDYETLGGDVHTINRLTVIASESYKDFVTDLQSDIKENLFERPTKASEEYFVGKTVLKDGEKVRITEKEAKIIQHYLVKNDYVDYDGNVTEKYKSDRSNGVLAILPDEILPITDGVHTLVSCVFDDTVLDSMIDDGNATKTEDNALNDNFYKKEFQTLWKSINRKYAYKAEFDSREVIEKAVSAINEKLYVQKLQYTATVSSQKDTIATNNIKDTDMFGKTVTQTKELLNSSVGQVSYDLVGKIAKSTKLTRKTVGEILQKINNFGMYKVNPEDFITKVIKIINDEKSTTIVGKVSYDPLEDCYDSDIFTQSKIDIKRATETTKHVQDYVVTDGISSESVEKKFADSLESASEVCVYAKLPRGFKIPTPVGNYSPDWAIAFNEGAVKHIFFIAETKGTMETLELRPIEQAKIKCAKRLFNEISTENVKYYDVDSYESMINIISNKL